MGAPWKTFKMIHPLDGGTAEIFRHSFSPYGGGVVIQKDGTLAMISPAEADRVCVPVPFYHCFGMVMGNLGATSHGSCIVIPPARNRSPRTRR